MTETGFEHTHSQQEQKVTETGFEHTHSQQQQKVTETGFEHTQPAPAKSDRDGIRTRAPYEIGALIQRLRPARPPGQMG